MRESQSLVTISQDGEVTVSVTTLAEAKLALKELKLKKKEFTLLKKQVSEQERQIRADYADRTRRHGSRFQGGGTIGRIIRISQTASRDSARRELAQQLAPYENQKREIEAIRARIDEVILKVETVIHQHS